MFLHGRDKYFGTFLSLNHTNVRRPWYDMMELFRSNFQKWFKCRLLSFEFFTADYASFHLWASNFHQFRSELNQPFLSVFRHNLKPNNKLKLQVASC